MLLHRPCLELIIVANHCQAWLFPEQITGISLKAINSRNRKSLQILGPPTKEPPSRCSWGTSSHSIGVWVWACDLVWRRKSKRSFSPGLSPSFCSSEGSRAISKPAPNPGTHQTPVETLSEIRLPLTGVKIPKIGKRGFQSQKSLSPAAPEKGTLKSPFLYRARQLFWGGGKWGLFDSETLFSRFGLRSWPPFTGVLRGPGRKVPPGVLFECFWALGAGAQKHLKSTPGGTLQPGPLSTPANGGRDRKIWVSDLQTHPGTNLGVFVPIWLVLPRCEATNLGVFDL